MRIRAIIVDDETLAREGIYSAEEPDVEIAEACADGDAAVRSVERHRPDLLFLDVQMPSLSGFDVLEALDPESMPLVIFTTAHDEHAIRAFEVIRPSLHPLPAPSLNSRYQTLGSALI